MSVVQLRPSQPVRIILADGSEITITAEVGRLLRGKGSTGLAEVGDRVTFSLEGVVAETKGGRW